MRIGMFADMYLPHISGVTNHIALYKRRFEELGHEVFVFTFGDLDHADTEPNIVRSGGLPWGDTGWRAAVVFSPEARRLIQTLDVAHVHHPFQSGPLALMACRRHGIPLVFTNHTRYELYSDSYASFVPRGLRYWFIRQVLRRFCRAADLVIAPAASIAEWLGEFAGYRDAVVVPNGIDVERFANPAERRSREEFGFAPEDMVLVYAGRLGPEKNTEWLAREFARAAATEPRLRLLVIGDGPSADDARAVLAQAGVADRAHFTGLVDYALVPGYEAVADAFVTGSITEVHPLVVLEAMAAGLPVLAVSSPGIADTVTDGQSGLLAPGAADGALAERMLAVARDAQLRERLRAGARAAADAYSFAHTADVVLAHYERLVCMRRKASRPPESRQP